ncbi:malonyl-ACP decarboxylase [Nonomuraea solani]|uniref:Malonyl-ACP decarboxylase n=1 Tax=Nonomuraea solani TaxID=1144553 RepID=A0A1H6ECE0_9ACTN|nr:beta-ketoacyl synthase N-terminal-like domain-containing protein [Nonomuraea solani]SEG95470.1 malonyl-ACP decarboxylase [Nonomuraea solani]
MRVAITGAAVLLPGSGRLADFDTMLREGGNAFGAAELVPGHEPVPASLLGSFSVRDWADDHLGDDREAHRRLRRAAGRAARPARTAACVALAAARAARLSEKERSAATVIVAGNNLALGDQAGKVIRYADDPGLVQPSHILDVFDTDAVGTVSQTVGAHAEGFSVGGASASGTVALAQAVRLVQAGFAARCLVVAPVSELSEIEVSAFLRSGAMSSYACRPFDVDRSGFLYGQGAAAVVLERPEDAAERGVPVTAEVLGHGQRLDGHRGTKPNADGQVAAMCQAIATAGLTPDDIDYVNAHATGSALGDATEADALHRVFGPSGHVRINATKALTGHCLSAAGLVELVATTLQMSGGYCHPNPWLDTPVRSDLRFVGTTAETCEVRFALSNSFAFGGINSSVVLGHPQAQKGEDR